MKNLAPLWPGHKRIAVIFNVCLEAWSDGKAPGISPMGNPLPAGVIDNTAISWANYGAKRGIYRLLDSFAKFNVKASVMTSAVLAQRHPQAVKAVAEGGHEILSHSYAMDVMPAMMNEIEEKQNIQRCTELLQHVSGRKINGWLSPRATPSANTARLLSEAGYRWYGDTLADDLPWIETYAGQRIVAIPLSTDVNDMPSMKYGTPPRYMLDTFEEYLNILIKHTQGPAIIDVTTHAHIFGRTRGAYYHERIIEAASQSNEIWIGTRNDVAELYLNHPLDCST